MSYDSPYYSEYNPPDTRVVALVEQISCWKKQNIMLYPSDIFNMLIDHSLVNLSEINDILERTKGKTTPAELPKQHLL